MRIYTVHKKRVLAVATATATLVFLVAIAFINQEPRFRVSLDYDGSERDTEVDDANTSLPVGKNVVTVSDSRKPPERDAVGDLPPPTDEEEEDEDGESQDDPDTAAAAAWEPETVDDTGSYELEDDEEDDDENSNGVFREGDFDVMPPEINSTTSDNPDDDRSNTSVTMNDVRWYERVVDRKLQAEPPLRSWKVESNTKRHLKHPNGMDVIEDGIYWSKDLERLVPRGEVF